MDGFLRDRNFEIKNRNTKESRYQICVQNVVNTGSAGPGRPAAQTDAKGCFFLEPATCTPIWMRHLCWATTTRSLHEHSYFLFLRSVAGDSESSSEVTRRPCVTVVSKIEKTCSTVFEKKSEFEWFSQKNTKVDHFFKTIQSLVFSQNKLQSSCRA